MNRKGNAAVWIIITVLVLVVSLTWIISTQFTLPFFDMMETFIVDYPDAAETFTKIKNVWNYWPVIFIVGLIIYAIYQSMRKEDVSYYQ